MCGFIAQLEEHRTGIAEVTGSNPVEALIFFRLLLSNCLNWKINCDDHSSPSFVFGCESFHDYLYGQREITVAGDHKPLEAIFKKPSIKHPSSAKDDSRDKAVCSHCQVQTRQASVPADALSRAYFPIENAHQCDEFEIHLLDSGELSVTMFQKLTDETKRDQDSSSCTQLS